VYNYLRIILAGETVVGAILDYAMTREFVFSEDDNAFTSGTRIRFLFDGAAPNCNPYFPDKCGAHAPMAPQNGQNRV
jgi:hypothetical protein